MSATNFPSQIGARPFDMELLKILCCPETHQELSIASASLLDQLNVQIAAGTLRNRADGLVLEKLDAGLIRADGKYLYAVRHNIPVMLVEEAIALPAI
jgi:uncharacterized protein YbaR (Trm112 family)